MIDEAYRQAINILKECVSDIGFKASALDSGYHEVWGRDSMITLLGAMLTRESDLIHAAQTSLNTLQKYQTELGLIPNNVDVKNNEPQYRAYMDGTIWYVIGVYFYHKQTGDLEFMKKHAVSVKAALNWLLYQDVDNSGLISTQEAGDWMDLFPVRGKVLYDNALYYGALRGGEIMAVKLGHAELAESYASRAAKVQTKILNIFWMDKAHDNIVEKLTELCKTVKNIRMREDEIIQITQGCVNNMVYRPYFLSFIGFRQCGDWFDTLGNMLSILFNIARKDQEKSILDYAHQAGIPEPYPAKSSYPPIYPGDREWRDYFKGGNLNLPNQYHNGGIWPFIGGFYTAALVKAERIKEAERALESLAKANYIGKSFEWEFNEWLHGLTGNPMGKEKQAWSAAMYIFAYNCVKNGKVDLL